MYVTGEYSKKNPTWHIEDSPWKAKQILATLQRNGLQPHSICEIGCGAGEVLHQLYTRMPDDVTFYGYDVSQEALELCKERAENRLHFSFGELPKDKETFDMVMVIDVVEHIEDYLGFLRLVRTFGEHQLFHIPLDLSVQGLFRKRALIDSRKHVGHLHYFSKETALGALEDAGYLIVDWNYTKSSMAQPPRSLRSFLARIPRSVLFRLSQDSAVRILGGHSLMVLTK